MTDGPMLVSVLYRAAPKAAPVSIIAQLVQVDGEAMIWVDGLNTTDPVVVDLSSCREIEVLGPFRDFLLAHQDAVGRLLPFCSGRESAAFLARCCILLAADTTMNGEEALRIVEGVALDILDSDHLVQSEWKALAKSEC